MGRVQLNFPTEIRLGIALPIRRYVLAASLDIGCGDGDSGGARRSRGKS